MHRYYYIQSEAHTIPRSDRNATKVSKNNRIHSFTRKKNSYSVAVVTFCTSSDDDEYTCANTFKENIIRKSFTNTKSKMFGEWCCTIGSNAPPLYRLGSYYLMLCVFFIREKKKPIWEKRNNKTNR